nr:transposase [Flavobacterium sp. LM4]
MKKLLKSLRIIGSTSEGIGYIPKEAMGDVLKINKVVIKQLQKAIEKVERKMKEIIQSNEQLKLQNELIQSIPGVGPQTALYIILVTKSFQSFENWRQSGLLCWSGSISIQFWKFL